MPKYYAIERNGIVKTWNECKSIVLGKSLRYKSFGTEKEASDYLDKLASVKPKPPKDETGKTVFYIDGSHIKGTERMGFGIYTKIDGVEYVHHQPVDPSWIAEFVGEDEKLFKKVSNCTMEVLSGVYLLKHLSESLRTDAVLIRYDYEGVGCWLRGFWKAREPYIVKIVELGKKFMKSVEEKGITIEWEWVRGHNGNAGNEAVDGIAKGVPLIGSHPLSELK